MTNASAVAASATADRMLLVSFSTCAAPGLSPATVNVRPHSEIIGRIRSTAAGSPETMTDKVPARAPGGPPEIGQSTTVTPRAAIARSISCTNGTPTVQVLTSSFMVVPSDVGRVASGRQLPDLTADLERAGANTGRIRPCTLISGCIFRQRLVEFPTVSRRAHIRCDSLIAQTARDAG